MTLVLTERIATKKTEEELLKIIETDFKQISDNTCLKEKVVNAENVKIWDIGTMLNSTTEISLKPCDNGFLIYANANYRASFWLWMFGVIAFFSEPYCLIGIVIIVFLQKKHLSNSIEACFKRIQTEVL
ncbi:MAG: hypothetical protein WC721_15605 [Victivallaceae bacterium]|jgi:hypothetical protein